VAARRGRREEPRRPNIPRPSHRSEGRRRFEAPWNLDRARWTVTSTACFAPALHPRKAKGGPYRKFDSRSARRTINHVITTTYRKVRPLADPLVSPLCPPCEGACFALAIPRGANTSHCEFANRSRFQPIRPFDLGGPNLKTSRRWKDHAKRVATLAAVDSARHASDLFTFSNRGAQRAKENINSICSLVICQYNFILSETCGRAA